MAPRPIVEAEKLSLRLSGAWAYREVDLSVAPRTLTVLTGSVGRSHLLRTLYGELTPTAGALTVCGHPMPTEAPAARRHLAVARLPSAEGVDPNTRLVDYLADQLVLSDLPIDSDVFDAAADLIGFATDRRRRLTELTFLERRLLSLALGIIAPVELVLVYDVDAGLDDHQQATLWQALITVSRTVAAVVASAEASPGEADRTVDLPAHQTGLIP